MGRNYVDATPTSGTIYVGGGGERLSAEVRVEPISGEEEAEARDERSSRTRVVLGRSVEHDLVPSPTAANEPEPRDAKQPEQKAQQSAQIRSEPGYRDDGG